MLKESNLVHPKYRADIDGLRAIAVLLVLFFHAYPHYIQGGFVGVDVFFVISGFLISTIIFGSLSKGSFSFREFFSRRVMRIFPSLLIVMLGSFIFGWFVLLDDEFQQLNKHIISGAAFVSNLTLWSESGYFDTASELKPLLHLWSLGIEEQFYIFWPLILWASWKYKFNKLPFFILLTGVSFYLNTKGVKRDGVATFYSPMTRFWELMLGGLLAHINVFRPEWTKGWILDRPDTKFKSAFQNVLSIVGFSLLIFAVLKVNKFTLFPGRKALLPTLGTLFIISAGYGAWINRRILSAPILVWFGLISYPLYLWHWPLLTYARIIFSEEIPFLTATFLIMVSVLLAWLTLVFIERPLRFGKQGPKQVAVFLSLMGVLGILGLFSFKGSFNDRRYLSHMNDMDIRIVHHRGNNVTDCGELTRPLSSSFCFYNSKTPNVAIIGDSHAGHLFHGFIESNQDFFNKALLIYAGSCQPTLGMESREGCGLLLNKSLGYIQNHPSIKYVVVSSYYDIPEVSEPETVERYRRGYVETLKQIIAMGKKPVFVIEPPTLQLSAESCSTPNIYLRRELRKYPEFCKGAREIDLRSHLKYKAYVESIKKEVQGALYYDPTSLFCSNGICKVFNEAELLYSDYNHLSIYGSKFLVSDLIRNIK